MASYENLKEKVKFLTLACMNVRGYIKINSTFLTVSVIIEHCNLSCRKS